MKRYVHMAKGNLARLSRVCKYHVRSFLHAAECTVKVNMSSRRGGRGLQSTALTAASSGVVTTGAGLSIPPWAPTPRSTYRRPHGPHADVSPVYGQ
jgi:hypothetical protein